MRSFLTFVAVIGGIVFFHVSKIKLPETPTPIAAGEPVPDLSIPGSTPRLPAPGATEALVFMPDSMFQSYHGDRNFYVTNHFHVLYVKTDTTFLTAPGPQVARRTYAGNMLRK